MDEIKARTEDDLDNIAALDEVGNLVINLVFDTYSYVISSLNIN
jgi:hypothetical protein